MKKTVISLLAILSISSTTSYATNIAKDAEISNYGIGDEQYKPIAKVTVECYAKWWSSFTMPLYAGVNTCYSYYFTDGTFYYPVRKNTRSEYQRKDVSGYDWTCTIGDCTYFFNY